MCRICLEDGGAHFCNCTGSCALVHTKCLQRWIDVSRRETCEICLSPYVFPKTFSCRFHLLLSDIQLSKSTSTSVLCCSFGFAMFLINFVLGIMLESFLVNIIASNIFTLLVVSFSLPFTNSLQFFIYMSAMITLSNVLVISMDFTDFLLDISAFYLQCVLNIILILAWTTRIVWRSSWVVSTINT